MAYIPVELAEAEACVDTREVDCLVDLDMGAHQRYPALDALRDQLPASIVQILEISREGALRLRGDAQGLGKVSGIVAGVSMGSTNQPRRLERLFNENDVPGDKLVALIEQKALVEVDVRMAKSVRLSQDRRGRECQKRRGRDGRADARWQKYSPALRIKLCLALARRPRSPPSVRRSSGAQMVVVVLGMARGRVVPAAALADAARAVRGGELDAVDAAADAVDVVERVGERGVVGIEREVHVADDERGVVRGGLGGEAGVLGAVVAGSGHVGVDVHGGPSGQRTQGI